uniref:Olfactory receptor n=1 Tax=Prolemur simus TaxID=1328070 RepID=A0A8C9ALP5_PROSS
MSRSPIFFIRFIHNMEPRNETTVSEFLLLEDAELQPVLFSLFLSMYPVTILGNLLIILAVISDSHLHTPMYLFLSNLSLADICLSTATVPKMLANIRTRSQSITYAGCLTQMFFVLGSATLENFLLAVMAYDRYVAICHPLRYAVIMNLRLCGLLILLCLSVSIMDALLHDMMVLQLSFCTHLEIPLFFCEVVQVIKLTCSDTLINNILIYFAAVVFRGVPLSGIIFSYTQIACSVLRMASASGKFKAFSTCGSHLSVVSFSAFTHSPRKTAVASMMYTVVTPMMNPFIHSLRNRDMTEAIRKLSATIPSFL